MVDNTRKALANFMRDYFIAKGVSPDLQEIFDEGIRIGKLDKTDSVRHIDVMPPERPQLRTQEAPLKQGGLLGFQLNVPTPQSYARGVPTAIGGTFNRHGRNVYWQSLAGSVDGLPANASIGNKGYVYSDRSVYDKTENGWVFNESDTKFIKESIPL